MTSCFRSNCRRLRSQGRLKPGRMLLVDTIRQEFKNDIEIKKEMATMRPVEQWVKGQVSLRLLQEGGRGRWLGCYCGDTVMAAVVANVGRSVQLPSTREGQQRYRTGSACRYQGYRHHGVGQTSACIRLDRRDHQHAHTAHD